MSDWGLRLKVAVPDPLVTELVGDNGAFGLTDSSLVFVDASGVQRCDLASVTRVNRDGGAIVVSGESGVLLRAPLEAEQQALLAFFGVVQKTAGQARSAAQTTSSPPPQAPPAAPLDARPAASSDAELISRDAPRAPAPAAPPAAPVGPRLSSVAPGEAPGGRLEYTGFGLRLLAAIIDSVLVSILTTVASIPFGLGSLADLTRFAALMEQTQGEVPDAAAVELAFRILGTYFTLVLVSIVVQWLYSAVLESSPAQGTFGKQWLGMKVTDMNGERIGFGRASGRYFAKIISGAVLFIGYLMALFSEKKQALHDMIAGTMVVSKPPR